MIVHTATHSSRFSLTAALVTLLSGAAPAATVSINQSAVSGGVTVAAARLRASNRSWDVGLANGAGFSNGNSRRVGFARSFLSPGRTYTFSLEHRAGQGFILTVHDNRSGRTTVQAWGTFATPPTSQRNIVATLGGQAPGHPFNALQIDAQATIASSRTTFSNLVFTAPDLTSSGSFSSGTLTSTTNIGSNPLGTATQSLLADVDLSTYSWKLGGTVGLMRGPGVNNSDDVSFTVSVMNAPIAGPPVVPVPEPATAAMLFIGGVLANRRRRA